MKLVKLILILVSIFGTSICFATQAEEIAELQNYVLTPIVENFSKGKGSPSEQLSKAIIAMEVTENRQFTRNHVIDLLNKGVFDAVIKDTPTMLCHNITDTEDFVTKYLEAWKIAIASCGINTNFVLIALEFNQMNRIEQGKLPLFKIVVKVSAIKPSDHTFVLVEGMSGTMYAVDAWMQKVVILSPEFTKLSHMKSPLLDFKDIKSLNILFSKPFYDAYYVNAATVWMIDTEKTKKTIDIVTKHNLDMEIFYNTLKHSFPEWRLPYSKLVHTPAKSTQK